MGGGASRPSTGNGWNAGVVRIECIIQPASTSKRLVLSSRSCDGSIAFGAGNRASNKERVRSCRRG